MITDTTRWVEIYQKDKVYHLVFWNSNGIQGSVSTGNYHEFGRIASNWICNGWTEKNEELRIKVGS